MSHFTTYVVLPKDTTNVDDALARVLAPFDENADVPPYKEYLDWQDDYGRAIKYYGEHPDRREPGLDEMDVRAVLSVFYGEQIREETSKDGGPVMYYRLSTYNPQSQWDWWQVGGRWSGRFPVVSGLSGADRARLINGERSWTNKDDPAKPFHADGGPVKFLDLEFMRLEAGTRAADRYNKFAAMTKGLPPARPFSSFYEEYEALHGEGNRETARTLAREAYHAQPVIQAVRPDPMDHTNEFTSFFGPDVVDEFSIDCDTYVQRARDGAVPGYAMVDLEGRWLAPGKMGWFGMSDDNEDTQVAYNARVNAYLETLDPECILVCLDLHI